jgi:peptidoglycan/LPS O-acetylase OafA/YrhL
MLLVVLGMTLTPAAGVAQARPPHAAASVFFSAAARGPLDPAGLGEPGDSVRNIRPTYWKEGALVGGGVGAVGGLLLGLAVCGLSEDPNSSCTGTTIAGALGGALLLAIPGALIGGQFDKGQSASSSQPRE